VKRCVPVECVENGEGMKKHEKTHGIDQAERVTWTTVVFIVPADALDGACFETKNTYMNK
jgi:hypothetical protein